MGSTTSILQNDRIRLGRALRLAAVFVALLWIIKLLETFFDLELGPFGVYPRRIDGLTGILTGPLVHGSWAHLSANTLPAMVLGSALFYGYPRSAKLVVAAIWLGSGLGVWLFARDAYHIGASGLTSGALFFLFVIGTLRRDRLSMVLTMLVFFLYGGMIWGIFPSRAGISFESHLFGAICGTLLAFMLKNHDPPAPEKTYSWQEEPGEETETQ